MSRRSRDWNEGLAKDLQNPEFAREFLLAAMEEGVSVQVALGKVIRAYGLKEFSKRAKLPSSNVLRSIDPKHNPTQETLSRILKPLGLMITVAPIPDRPRLPKGSRRKARA